MLDEEFMLIALEEAKAAAHDGEVPVGAVIVKDGKVISTGRNRREKDKNALAHAEIEAINKACTTLGGWRLFDCELYVTLEPCCMCAGAIVNSRIKRVIYGCHDKKAGATGSVVNIFSLPLNHSPAITAGVLENECSGILKDFFKNLRRKQTKGNVC